MMFVVLLALFVFFAVRAWFSPYTGLLGLLAANIIQPGEIYPVFDTIRLERVMAVIVLVSALRHREKLRFPPLTKGCLAFWGAIIIGVPFAWWVSGAMGFAIEFGKTMIYHVLIVSLLTTAERFTKFIYMFTSLIGWTALSSATQYFSGNYVTNQGVDRAVGMTSIGGDPNTLGLTLACALPLALLTAIKATRLWKIAGAAVTVASVVTVVLTGSRMSFMAVAFFFAIYAASRKRYYIYIPLALAVAGLVWISLPTEYQERYSTVRSLEQDISYQNRLVAWRGGWNMFKDNPLTGVGMGQFPNANGAKYWPGPGPRIWLNAHSLYLQLIAELGFIGVIAFAAYLWAVLRTNFKLLPALRHREDLPGVVRFFPAYSTFSILILLFAGYSSHNLYRSTWYMLGALTAALQLLATERVQDTALAEEEHTAEESIRVLRPADVTPLCNTSVR